MARGDGCRGVIFGGAGVVVGRGSTGPQESRAAHALEETIQQGVHDSAGDEVCREHWTQEEASQDRSDGSTGPA